MKRRRPQQPLVEVRKILEAPIVKKGEAGPSICAYEASRRRAAHEAAAGNMKEARFFLRELHSYGLPIREEPQDDHQYLIKIPKEWDDAEWHAMFDQYGPPPWPGARDGLISKERWVANYGTQARPRVRSRSSRGTQP
jgi:hypothetical protein